EPDGILTHFDWKGRLRWKRDPNGNFLAFYYGANDDEPLTAVIDALGREFFFMYDFGGRLQEVTDFLRRPVKYDYEIVNLKLIGEDRDPPKGMPPLESRLIGVRQYAPINNETPFGLLSKVEWRYAYLTPDEIREAVKPLSFPEPRPNDREK